MKVSSKVYAILQELEPHLGSNLEAKALVEGILPPGTDIFDKLVVSPDGDVSEVFLTEEEQTRLDRVIEQASSQFNQDDATAIH